MESQIHNPQIIISKLHIWSYINAFRNYKNGSLKHVYLNIDSNSNHAITATSKNFMEIM